MTVVEERGRKVDWPMDSEWTTTFDTRHNDIEKRQQMASVGRAVVGG